MTTLDTAFASNDGALTSENLLQVADGEITLIERDNQNLEAVTALDEVIATDGVYDLGDLGQQVPVYNSGVAHANAIAVITATDAFSIVTLTTVAGKTITVADTENNPQTVTLATDNGTIQVTGASQGVITNNGTAEVTVTGAVPGTITYSYTAGAEGTATLTFNSTDGVKDAAEKTTTVTVTAA